MTTGRLSRWIAARRFGPHRAAFLDHTLPSELRAGEIHGVRVTVRNESKSAWEPDGASPTPVALAVFVDDEVRVRAVLPHRVPPGGEVSFHFALQAPSEGRHRVKVDLVHDHVAWFEHEGNPPLATELVVREGRHGATCAALARAVRHNPWHYLPTSGIAESRSGDVLPLFVSKAAGPRFWDAEGNEFIDYTMGWGTALLGYADPRVQRAIARALETAPLAPFPDPLEMTVAERLVSLFPGAEMAIFGKNGSDVCTLAARFARLATGRETILSCGFHGWQDFNVPGPGFHEFRFNDRESFRAALRHHDRDLAAVIVEPAGPHQPHDDTLGGDADAGFLREIADSTRERGGLVIFDEIMTAFRYPRGGVQRATGVTADLTCLGKAMAAGMPLSALLGPSRVFHAAYHGARYNPTFKAEVYSLAAAEAALEIYASEPIADIVWRIGARLSDELNAACRASGLDARVTGVPFRLTLSFGDPDPYRRRLQKTLYVQELLRGRVVTVSGIMLPSAAHDDEVVACTMTAARRAVDTVAHASREGALERAVEIPLL